MVIIFSFDWSTEATFSESLPLFFSFSGLSSSSLDSVTTGGNLQSLMLCFFLYFMQKPTLHHFIQSSGGTLASTLGFPSPSFLVVDSELPLFLFLFLFSFPSSSFSLPLSFLDSDNSANRLPSFRSASVSSSTAPSLINVAYLSRRPSGGKGCNAHILLRLGLSPS